MKVYESKLQKQALLCHPRSQFFFHSPMMNTGNQKEGTGVAFAPAEGGSRGGADPRVGANVTRPPLAWQAH